MVIYPALSCLSDFPSLSLTFALYLPSPPRPRISFSLPPILLAKVLPIERRAGPDQKLLLNFSRKLAAGEWCHIFPEGKTVQVRRLLWRSW